MSERLIGRCDCGRRMDLLDHSEWCPCEYCHPGGRHGSAPTGASSPSAGAPTLRWVPTPRHPPEASRVRQASPGIWDEAGAGLEDRPRLPERKEGRLVTSADWLERRRALITATDIPAILGLSPYRSEGDVARDKLGLAPESPPSVPMRVGSALEPLVAALWSEATGRPVERWGELVVSEAIPWAGATPDYRSGDCIVECKASTARRWSDGLPQDVEAQVRWQLGVTGLAKAEVAALVGYDLRIYPVEHDPALFGQLVIVADDFRRRLEAGGPFAETAASIDRAHPVAADIEFVPDATFEGWAQALLDARRRAEEIASQIEALETRIKQAMGPASLARGDGWRITWRNVRDREQTDWAAVAREALERLPEDERDALIRRYTSVRSGGRRFVIRGGRDGDED